MNNAIEKALNNAAAADMRNARKRGTILIGQTLKGTVALSHDAGAYKIVQQGGASNNFTPADLFEGKAAGCKTYLKSLYRVD